MEYKSSVPPTSKEFQLMKEFINLKADEKWVLAEFRTLEEKAKDCEKKIGENRRLIERPHECFMEMDISDLKGWKKEMTSFKIIVFMAILTSIVGAAGYIFFLDGTVTNTRENVLELKESVKELRDQTSQNRLLVEKELNKISQQRKDEFLKITQQIEGLKKTDNRRRKK